MSKIEPGSGNVLEDAGMPDPEEALRKAELARNINAALNRYRITNTVTGDLFDIPRYRVADLAAGRLVDFSLGQLQEFGRRVGLHFAKAMDPNQ